MHNNEDMMNTRKFDLNIEEVLEDWEIYHAVREIIANALDEQALTKTEEIEIRKENAEYIIRDFGRGLRYEHLTQNENKEKLSHPEIVIGKFGVGLKDALATLHRHHVKIMIKSKYGDITIDKSSKLGFEDVITLHAMISSPTNPTMEGTEVRLSGCSEDDIEKAKHLFMKFAGEQVLEKTDYGEILKKINQVSNIYITGVKVAEEENFLFSYNITSLTSSMRKALNRERTNVGRTAYTERVKSILLSSKTKTVAQLLIEDLAKYQQGVQHDELKYNDIAIHACKMLNSISQVVFVTPQQLQMNTMSVDNVRRDGYEVVVIPEAIQTKITNEKDVLGNVIRDLHQYNIEYNASFEFKFIEKKNLNNDEVLIFERTNDIFKLIGGKPSIIDQILISETMRREEFGTEAVGIWESDKRRIVIKRNQLNNLENYAGTLLHETAHAISHAGDVSREFESALTELLGITAAKSTDGKSDNRFLSFLGSH